MKSEHKSALKLVLICLAIGLAAFIVWEVSKAVREAIKAGKSFADGFITALMAPFNGLAAAWTAVTNLFSFDFSAPKQVTDADTAGINDPLTSQPITEDTTIAGIILGTPGQSQQMGWEAWLQSIQN